MPWIQYVTVKEATGLTSAKLYPLKDARGRLTLGAKRAVEDLAHAKVLKVTTPVDASVTAFPPADLAWLADMPGIHYQNQTVSFTAPDARAAYRAMQAVGSAAMLGYGDALYRALQSSNARAVELLAIAEWDAKWIASEQARAKANGRDKY
jgi:D-aminopeptidase